MANVAIVTDSAADLPPAQAAAAEITVVPLLLTFGEREYHAGVDITTDEFWRELTAPGAPFPKTAAAAPGTFRETFEGLFVSGAEEVVYVGVGEKLSATIASAKVARDMLRERRIHIVDSASASMGIGLLALLAAERAAAGASGAEIAAEIERRRDDLRLYVVLETLEYLKRGGRISPARAAIGGVLSVKPIITIEDGVVETADKPRTRSKARARLLELFGGARPERVAVLHGQSSDVASFADELAEVTGYPRSQMTIHLIGSSVGPHVGPGAYGAVVLLPAGG
ncbi:MAG TPA: DegV family protein [Candidatus Limnocylindria bacterium]|nr:DegV family protein [Candidatus Limnocylindria bacterium]